MSRAMLQLRVLGARRPGLEEPRPSAVRFVRAGPIRYRQSGAMSNQLVVPWDVSRVQVPPAADAMQIPWGVAVPRAPAWYQKMRLVPSGDHAGSN